VNQLRIAYLINEYPKVSHSFIRREILALERQGFDVLRIALRGWDTELVDREDLEERKKTHYALQSGIISLIFAALKTLVTRPTRFFLAFQQAIILSRKAERSWPYHLAYLLEASAIITWIEQFKATHIHAHFGTNSTEVALLTSTLGKGTFSFTVHGSEFDNALYTRFDEKVKHAAFVIAICSYGRSQLYRWTEYQNWHKYYVVHCGLESAFYDLPAAPIPTNIRVVCVGRFHRVKGHLLLLEGLNCIAQKGIDFELVLAGDGEMRPELEALILQYKLQDKVRITGWISSDQVREEILMARGLVQPSFSEGLPIVIMEAMSQRRPILSTYVGGIPELVRNDTDGWLFPAGDLDGLVTALEKLFTAPVEVLEKMGEAGHKRVLERHSVDTEITKLAQLFRSEINKSSLDSPFNRLL
jgi:glycosyltransferase involved in cell wall biosynthesis